MRLQRILGSSRISRSVGRAFGPMLPRAVNAQYVLWLGGACFASRASCGMAGTASGPRMIRPNLASLARVWSGGLSAQLRSRLGTTQVGIFASHDWSFVFV